MENTDLKIIPNTIKDNLPKEEAIVLMTKIVSALNKKSRIDDW